MHYYESYPGQVLSECLLSPGQWVLNKTYITMLRQRRSSKHASGVALQPIVSPQKITQVTDAITKNTVFSPAFMNRPQNEWLSQSQQPAVRSSSNIVPHGTEGHQQSQPNSLRYVLVNGSAHRNQQVLVREMLTKKSMKVLVTLKKNAYKTQYGKLLRAKKEEEGKKSTITTEQKVMARGVEGIGEMSEEQLVVKYRELLQGKEKNRPFNMINKLYQVDALSTKEAPIVHKLGTGEGDRKPGSEMERRSSRLNGRSYVEKVRTILMGSATNTSKVIPKQYLEDQQTNNHNKQEQVRREQGYSSTTTAREEVSVSKASTPSCGPKVSKQQLFQRRSDITSNRADLQQHRLKKKVSADSFTQQANQAQKAFTKIRSIQLTTPKLSVDPQPTPSIRKQLINSFPPPKNVTANAFIVYQVKPSVSIFRADTESPRKKEYLSRVMTALNSKTAYEMASLTKIMTCLVVIELTQRLQIDTSKEKYMVGIFESQISGTSAEIEPGEVYTIHQLLLGLMLPSGNDASLALARWAGNLLLIKENKREVKRDLQAEWWAEQNIGLRSRGDKLKAKRCYNRFLAQMNKKARVLGLERTSFSNSHGLSNPYNKSSCLDLAFLCEYAMRNKYFREIVSCKEYQAQIDKEVTVDEPVRPKMKGKCSEEAEEMNIARDQEDWEESEDDNDEEELSTPRVVKKKERTTVRASWTNTHKLLHSRPQYQGIKTGVTTTAGPCLASHVTVCQKSFVIVVLNCKKLSQRFADTEILRHWLIKQQKALKAGQEGSTNN